VTQELDIAFGAHARQKLDVYHVADGKQGKTIVIYIPGGGFTGGDKRQDDNYFGNVCRFFARQGMVGVAANYRLAPEFAWPSAGQDVQSAVRWMKANATRFGGDPGRVVIFGHSAGSSHVASYLFDPDLRGGDEVMGGVLASGLYALRKEEMRANVAQYFGDDEALYAQRSALTHVGQSKAPVFLAVAEMDPVYLITPTFEMARALSLRDKKPPHIIRLAGHNHFSTMCTFGTVDDSFSTPLTEWIRSL
jgi:triacylglycerol lipase